MENQQVLTGNNIDAPNQLLQCTSVIVASHLRRVAVETAEISSLIVSVHKALSTLPTHGEITTDQPLAANLPSQRREPSVPAPAIGLKPPAVRMRTQTQTQQPRVSSGAPSKRMPACSPARSVFDNYIVCLMDGRKLKTLTRHIKKWNLTPDSYRAMWGLPPDYPMTCRNYSTLRSEMAKARGLGAHGRKPNGRAKPALAPEPIETPQADLEVASEVAPVVIEPIGKRPRVQRPPIPPAPVSVSSDHPSGVVIRRFEAGTSGLRVKRRPRKVA